MRDLMIWLLLVDALAVVAMVANGGGLRPPMLTRAVVRTTRPRSQSTPAGRHRSR